MKKLDLNNTTAGREPFKMPEGYFEDFTARMMAKIPAEKQEAAPAESAGKAGIPFWKTAMYAKVKPYLYLAAMMCGLYFGISVYKYQQGILLEKQQLAVMQNAEQKQLADELAAKEADDYINDACDYMMADGYDIMACVTGSE